MIYFYLSGLMFLMMSIMLFILSIMMFLLKFEVFLEWSLMTFNSMQLNFLLYLDWISLLFIFTVMLISSMVMFYCIEYMSHEIMNLRFFYLVFLFILSMGLMILSPNLISIILGWDGLGLTSYCLVIFYQNYFSYNSGMLTVLMNRVGDILIMMSISLMIMYGSWNFMNLNFENFYLFIFIILASFTKSAQFPFSSWLPAAMAAPTPVSSLVHSSTLVTAGVYLLIRFHYLLYKNLMLMYFILIVSMITMVMAGVFANFEYDFKKIIAFSTLSQLGLMMMIYSMKFFILSYFHLIVHAMFKSMMFMCSGIVIHSMLNYQDIRFMGNLLEFMPFTFLSIMVANFALCGMPFFSGFYSKDLILEKFFMSNFFLILYIFLIMGTLLTVIYSVRLIYYLLSKKFNFFSFFKINDYKFMNFSLLILMFNSLVFGYLMNWVIYMNIEEIYLMSLEKMLILLLCMISILLGKKFFIKKFYLNYMYMYMSGKMFFLNYMNFFYVLSMTVYKNYYFLVDKGVENLSSVYSFTLVKLMWVNLFNNNNLLEFLLLMSFIVLVIFMI
uniref:NADH dehydrogenase subunit 5 n=1 Tax=Lamennaisia ambigua TaxID=3064205 RepID=UPI00286A5430|nr:NADH dehydrogenase subunit 5 [Lamennaisia ambigua]WKV28905.1 NADH dehydrogenase subunit 5 [Lamennaisia ambigua]